MKRFQFHEYRPAWTGSALVFDAETMHRFLIEQPNSPMMAGNNSRSSLTRISAEDLTQVFMTRKFSASSHSTLFSILEYHRAAIDSPTPENQLLNLWAGIEGMMPAPFGDKAHVLHFVDMLMPSLTLTYVEQHIRYLVESYAAVDQALMDFVREFGVGSSELEQCASLLACPELGGRRLEFMKMPEMSPLLRLRTESIVAKLSSPLQLKKALERRRKWMGWQMQALSRSVWN